MKKDLDLQDMNATYGENFTTLVYAGEGISIENGVISATGANVSGLVITATWTDSEHATLDKTYAEIKAELDKGIMPVIKQVKSGSTNYYGFITFAGLDTYYNVNISELALGAIVTNTYTATTETGTLTLLSLG